MFNTKNRRNTGNLIKKRSNNKTFSKKIYKRLKRKSKKMNKKYRITGGELVGLSTDETTFRAEIAANKGLSNPDHFTQIIILSKTFNLKKTFNNESELRTYARANRASDIEFEYEGKKINYGSLTNADIQILLKLFEGGAVESKVKESKIVIDVRTKTTDDLVTELEPYLNINYEIMAIH